MVEYATVNASNLKKDEILRMARDSKYCKCGAKASVIERGNTNGKSEMRAYCRSCYRDEKVKRIRSMLKMR